MRVAVSASEPSLDSQVDPRFGRCAYFVVVDPAAMTFEVVENSAVAAAQGAGIATAQVIAGKGVEAVLTGNCGPNAYEALSAAGIRVVTGVSGSVREAASAYEAGRLQASAQPNVASHYGMGVSSARGMGGGMRSAAPQSSPADADTALVGLLKELQSQLDGLRSQVNDINTRISELHKTD